MEFTLEELIQSFDPAVMPDPTLLRYYLGLQKRQIIINNEITDRLLEMATLPFMEMDSDGSLEPIEILLSSEGGDLYYGFNLIDQIDKATTPTTIHIMGMAASMGLLIAMAGKNNPNVKTVCHPFSVGLLHSGDIDLKGTLDSAEDSFNFLQKYRGKIKRYILSHSQITKNYYAKIQRNELWLDAEDMLKLGIVDEII